MNTMKAVIISFQLALRPESHERSMALSEVLRVLGYA